MSVLAPHNKFTPDAKIFVIFNDSRDSVKVFKYLQKNHVRFTLGGGPLLLQCMKVSRDVVEKVSRMLTGLTIGN